MSSGRSCNPSSMLLSPRSRLLVGRSVLGNREFEDDVDGEDGSCGGDDHCMVFWDWRVLDRIEHCSSWKLEYCQFGVILGDYVSN